jgi:hypothetical protein
MKRRTAPKTTNATIQAQAGLKDEAFELQRSLSHICFKLAIVVCAMVMFAMVVFAVFIFTTPLFDEKDASNGNRTALSSYDR